MAIKKQKQAFHQTDFTNTNSEEYHFENCEFVSCQFPDLSDRTFINCLFKDCNLSNVKVNQAKFQDVEFVNCKLMGINFSQSIDFAFLIHCVNCNLDYTSFDKKKLNKSLFENCKIHGANFTQADLSKCHFLDCDFFESVFSYTNLSGVDFTKSKNFLIDPEINSIKKAKFLLPDLANLLYRHDIIIEA